MLRYVDEKEAATQVGIRDAVSVLMRLFKAGPEPADALPRQIIELPYGNGFTLFMPAIDRQQAQLGIKVSSLRTHNSALPAINGVYLLIDYKTGAPLAAIDGNFITRLRTAATSALVTQAVVKPGIEHTLAILGAGAQALAHAEALCVTQSVALLRLASRSRCRAEEAAQLIRTQPWAPRRVEVAADLTSALVGATILCTCTSTSQTTPLVQRRNLPSTLQHINAIGGSTVDAVEVASDVYQHAQVIVEAPAAAAESGDLKTALAQQRIELSDLVTISDLLGRPRSDLPNQPSVFRSVGLASEDLALAHRIFVAVAKDGEHD